MPATLQLEAVLDVKRVGTALEQARKACAEDGPLEIDGSQVTAIDTAGAQLLFSLLNTAGARASWRLSEALARELTALGFPLDRFTPRSP